MKNIIGVRFKPVGKIYYFDPLDLTFESGDAVIVETVRGLEFAYVVVGNREVEDEDLTYELKPVVRKATDDDYLTHKENQIKEENAFNICKEKILDHALEMKLLLVEYTFDGSKIIFSFTSENRVDFRELVKDLASEFHTRIELRQIGVRDEAKLLSGVASCGRECCCSSWKGSFDTVSIKMAKNQNLALNPAKISGVCGRLMCCLRYEEETYKELKQNLPRAGQQVYFEKKSAEVDSLDILGQRVKLKIFDAKEDTFTLQWVDVELIEYDSKR